MFSVTCHRSHATQIRIFAFSQPPSPSPTCQRRSRWTPSLVLAVALNPHSSLSPMAENPRPPSSFRQRLKERAKENREAAELRALEVANIRSSSPVLSEIGNTVASPGRTRTSVDADESRCGTYPICLPIYLLLSHSRDLEQDEALNRPPVAPSTSSATTPDPSTPATRPPVSQNRNRRTAATAGLFDRPSGDAKRHLLKFTRDLCQEEGIPLQLRKRVEKECSEVRRHAYRLSSCRSQN